MGSNPSSIEWKYINSKAVKVIFPAGREQEAFRLANIIDYISDSAGTTVGPKRKHLDMVLQTNQVISNGYVGLAPYRSELFGTAPQNFNQLGSVSWLDLLAFHEYRHALQFINSRRGLTMVGYYAGGETLWSILAAISVPAWYSEGDAVLTETLFSDAGRGRTPYFFQEQRALLLNNKNYKYIKARNGSFRHLLPDHYRLGYTMLQQVRNEKGPDAWSKILKQGSAYSGVFYPFSRAMKRNAGYTSRKLYKHSYESLQKQWLEELQKIQLTPTALVNERPEKTVSNYDWPHVQQDSSIICIKSSYNKNPEIIKLKDGKESKITSMGFSTEPFMSQNNNMLAWTEFNSDPRWQNRNYNVIVSYNVKTGDKKRITSKTKLFSPQFSSGGDQLVAVKADENLKNEIVFIDPSTGAETGNIPNPENDFLSYPNWTKGDGAIVFLVKRNSSVAMMKYDLATKAITQLLPWSQNVIGGLFVGKEAVYYCAGYSGINNIYTVSLNGDQVIRQITSVKIGAEMPALSADEKTLYMTEFNYMGNELTKMDMSASPGTVITPLEPVQMERYKVVTTPVESRMFDRIPNQQYEVKKYNAPFRGTKFHSWFFNPLPAMPSVSFAASNILNDFGVAALFGYNTNEKTMVMNVNADYARYYLPLNVHAGSSFRALISPDNLAETGETTYSTTEFNEVSFGGGLSLPLTWYCGYYRTSFRAYSDMSRIYTNHYRYDEIHYEKSTSLTSVEGGFSLAHLQGRARQHVLPRWGQVLNVTAAGGIAGVSAEKYQADATLYFPGVMRNHSLSFSGGWKKELLKNEYRYLDLFNHARGYTPIQGDEEYVVSGNYQLPLCYPDFGFAGLFYLQRIRTNLFYDYSQVIRKDMDKTFDQRSYGMEMIFDANYFNVLALSVGARLSILQDRNYFNQDQKAAFQFFFTGTF